MNRSATSISVLILLITALAFPIMSEAAGITQKIVTLSIPRDYQSTEAYKVEFTIPEGSIAFNFTLWGSTKKWGIVDISGGAYKEVYSSVGGNANGDTPVPDAESSERVTDSTPETGMTDPLSRVTLLSGSYIIWMEGNPGTTMTLQYNLKTQR